MRKLLLFVACCAVAWGCQQSDHPGYKRFDKSVHYRLGALGDEDRTVADDKFISLQVDAYTFEGKRVARKHISRIRFSESTLPDAVRSILRRTAEKDSLSIIGTSSELDAANWFAPIPVGDDSSLIRLEVAITEVLTAEEILQLRAEERVSNDSELEELKAFKYALDSLGMGPSHLVDGIYFASIIPGKGQKPASGDEVTVHYRTFLTDGTVVDDTYQGQPLEYIIGKPDQVLPGFATAIASMREGGQAVFVIPSDLAYGDRGSSSGIVPPYAGLIYEAELVKVRK